MYKYYNPNPLGRRTVGDCAVRAVAKAIGVSWDEAHEMLSDMSKNMGTVMNDNDVISAVLRMHGFDTYITTKSGEAVPPAKYYIVQEGDTLGEIAANYGTSIEALLQLNPSINNPDLIYVGQKIRIS